MTPDEIARLPYRPCVGIVLVNRDREVFVGQRIDHPGPAWQMPQGGVDPGEDPRAAALRELHEETGVTADLVTIEEQTDGWIPYDLPHELVPKLWKGRFRGQEQRWFLMRFSGRDDQIDITRPPAEFARWRWVPKEDLIGRIVPFKREVYQAVLDAFGDRI